MKRIYKVIFTRCDMNSALHFLNEHIITIPLFEHFDLHQEIKLPMESIQLKKTDKNPKIPTAFD